LAGHFAYKLKKPIVTEFLDYGTLEKRHHACCEELRLDSRYAEGLYLDVVPITLEDGRVKMDGDAQPIEFALRMRRFAADSLLSERIRIGRVEPDEMVQLAMTIATFHRRAERKRDASEASLALTLQHAMANFLELDCVALKENQAQIERIKRWTQGFFSDHRIGFQHRAQEGFVRECHGDLHCDNIVFWHDHWVPFDGIEFNPDYSWIDVLSDVGFLMMDLLARDRLDLASAFLNAYLEETGDYDSLALLRWYMVYRALVRAKVALMRYHQTLPDIRHHTGHLVSVRSLLMLAERLTQIGDRSLWITHGVSGSGKTTGSYRYVLDAGAVRLRSDIERKRLFGTTQSKRPSSGVGQGIYSESATETVYQLLQLRTRELLQAGFSVVVDATFLKQSDRQAFHAIAAAEKVQFHILDFQADESTLRERITTRNQARKDASEATILVLDRQLREQEPLTPEERTFVLPSDSQSNYEDLETNLKH
jgi:aminoglycoside phosphotransferase family enzyme/predicted kinase